MPSIDRTKYVICKKDVVALKKYNPKMNARELSEIQLGGVHLILLEREGSYQLKIIDDKSESPNNIYDISQDEYMYYYSKIQDTIREILGNE